MSPPPLWREFDGAVLGRELDEPSCSFLVDSMDSSNAALALLFLFNSSRFEVSVILFSHPCSFRAKFSTFRCFFVEIPVE
jgi:hypothetical protein